MKLTPLTFSLGNLYRVLKNIIPNIKSLEKGTNIKNKKFEENLLKLNETAWVMRWRNANH